MLTWPRPSVRLRGESPAAAAALRLPAQDAELPGAEPRPGPGRGHAVDSHNCSQCHRNKLC